MEQAIAQRGMLLVQGTGQLTAQMLAVALRYKEVAEMVTLQTQDKEAAEMVAMVLQQDKEAVK